MKTAKLLWSSLLVFALFLPLAFAQVGGVLSSPWIYFMVNTLVLWFIFFIAVSLAGSKEEKEKKMLQLGAFAIAAIVSWNFVGGSGFIWQVGKLAALFSLKFIVNLIIISFIIWLLVKWLVEADKAPQSGAGQTGMWVLIILFAGIFAIKMPYYFWEGGTGKQLISFLFGSQGILSIQDNRLFIFISGWLLFSWLFTEFGIGGNISKLNYIMGFIVAANLASGQKPTAVGTMVKIGQVISWIVIARNMGKGAGGQGIGPGDKLRWAHWLWSFLLVDWIVGMIFPEHVMVGIFTGFSLMKVGMFFVAILVLLVFMARWNFDNKSRTARVVSAHLGNKFGNMWNSMVKNVPILRNWMHKLRNIPDREPEIVSQNRLLFLRMLDMELRMDVYNHKYEAFDKIKRDIVNLSNQGGAEESYALLKRRMIGYRSKKGQVVGLGTEKDAKKDAAEWNLDRGIVGWAYTNKLIVDYYNQTILKLNESPNKLDDVNRWCSTEISGTLKELNSAWENSVDNFRKKRRFAEMYQELRARSLLLELYNCSGEANHPYLFRENKEVTVYGEDAKEARNGATNKALKNVKQAATWAPSGKNLGDTAGYMWSDWEEFMNDFRFGSYHKMSRNIAEYTRVPNRILREEEMAGMPEGGSNAAPAFDLRALADGKFKFPGREEYEGKNMRFNSSDPHISYAGIRRFLFYLVGRTSAQKQEDMGFISQNYTQDFTQNAPDQVQPTPLATEGRVNNGSQR